jgi:hypothetical protein
MFNQPWNMDLHRVVLTHMMADMPVPAVTGPDGKALTWLVDDDGKPRFIPIDDPVS